MTPTSNSESYELTHLDHGIQVVSQRMPGVRSVSLAIYIPVGTRYEAADAHGYAHFVEHLLFKGTDATDALAISRYFDGIGSDANAATTKEHTVVHTRVLDRHLAGAFEMLGGMVSVPAFRADDVDAEREVILEEIAMYDDQPSDVVHDLADAMLFGEHDLGRPIVGTAESIGASTATGVRDFHARHYGAGNFVVSAAGNLEHDELVRLVAEHLHAPDGGESAPALVRPEYVTGIAQVAEQESEQAHVCISVPGIPRGDSRRHAAAVLDTLLGGMPSSRLFASIREREGLAYSVYSFFSSYTGAGQAGAYVGVRPDRLEHTLRILDGELDAIVAEPPTETELARAKDHIEGRMLLSLESTGARSSRLGGYLVSGMEIETPERTLERFAAVTAADVHALACELFARDQRSIAVVAEDGADAARAINRVLGLTAAPARGVAI